MNFDYSKNIPNFPDISQLQSTDLIKARDLPWKVTPLNGFSSSFSLCRANINIFGMARTLSHLLRLEEFGVLGEYKIFRIFFCSSASLCSSSSSRVKTCAFARLSTAMAKNTFSNVSVIVELVKECRFRRWCLAYNKCYKLPKCQIPKCQVL